VKLAGGSPHEALLVSENAIGTDQNVKFVFVLGKDNKVEYRAVQLGRALQGLRIVSKGLAPGDVIVINGLQRVRPGTPVTPKKVTMGAGLPQPLTVDG